MAFLEEFLHGLASIEATPYSQRLLLLGRSTDHLRECFSKLQPGRLLQRPVHIQRWRTREEEIHRREERIRKDEEDLCKKLDCVKQEQEAAQKAWKIRVQAKKIEEGLRQWEEKLHQQERKSGQREDLLLQREAAVDLKEKNLKQVEQEVEQRMAGLEKKAEEIRVREGEVEQKIVHIENEFRHLQQEKELGKRQAKISPQQELALCPQCRILLIGYTGVGKSSLVRSIVNIDPEDIDVSHDRPGRTNIEQGYTSKENTGFILHESPGFEPGSEENWNTMERFLRYRSKMKLAERVHAIWLCISTPREGTRLLKTCDEHVLSLARELDIPVIAVFTKYDTLVKELLLRDLDLSTAEKNAENYFNDRVRNLQQRMQVSVVKVSTSDYYTGSFNSLLELTKVTRKCLGEEAGMVPFPIALRVGTSQKVALSVRHVFKEHWSNFGNGIGHELERCVWRIHGDILQVWNLNDPKKLLSDEKFHAEMILLVEPMLESKDNIGLKTSVLKLKFLSGQHQTVTTSAPYFGAYITGLTCILHLLSQELSGLESDVLTEDLISRTVTQYKRTQSSRHHNLIRSMGFPEDFEKKILKLILEETETLIWSDF